MAPKQTKFYLEKNIQSVLSFEDEDNLKFLNNKIMLLFLTEINSIIFSGKNNSYQFLIECLSLAKNLNEKHNLNLIRFPDLKIAIGQLDPLNPDRLYFLDSIYNNDLSVEAINKFQDDIKEIKQNGVKGIRFHPGSMDLALFESLWLIINDFYSREEISLHVDRVNQSNAHITNLIKLAYGDKSASLMIEVDGASSFGEDVYRDTLQTIATADIIIKEFIKKKYKDFKKMKFILSGQITPKTISLINLCSIEVYGFSHGSHYNNFLMNKFNNIEISSDLLNNKKTLLKYIEHIKSTLYIQ